MHSLDGLTELERVARGGITRTQRVIEDMHAARATMAGNEIFDLLVVDGFEFASGEEVRHAGGMIGKNEAGRIEAERVA